MQNDGNGAAASNQNIILYVPATVQLLLHEMTHNADGAHAYKTPGTSGLFLEQFIKYLIIDAC